MCEKDVEERLRSKCYKTRIEAYEHLKSCWKKGDYACTHLLPLMAREANIPALEVLLDALSYHKNLSDMRPLLGFLGNSRTSLKNKLRTLARSMAKQDPEMLCEELVALCSHKNTRLALGAADMLKELVSSNVLADVTKVLPVLLKHQDAGMRKEGVEIALEMHKHVGDDIFKVLGDIKPIQLNELKERCSALKDMPGCDDNQPSSADMPTFSFSGASSGIKPGENRSSISDAAFSSRYAPQPSSVLVLPTRDEEESALGYFHKKYPFLKDREWKKRLDGLEENFESIKKEDPCVLNTFIYAYKEPVFQISLRLLECASIEERSILCAYCVKKITETKMRDAIYAVLLRIDYDYAISCLIESLIGKNGKVFVEIVNALVYLGRPGCERIRTFIDGCNASGRIEKDAIKRLKEEQSIGECEASFSQLNINPRSLTGSARDKAANEKLQGEEERKPSAGCVSEEVAFNQHPECSDDWIPYNGLATDKKLEKESQCTAAMQAPLGKQDTTSSIVVTCSQSVNRRETPDAVSTLHTDDTCNTYAAVSLEKREGQAEAPRLKWNDILLPCVSKMRIKNGKMIEKVFTKEFLRIMREEKPQVVLCELRAVDIVLVSDFVIKFYIDNHLDIEPLAAHFIDKKYILKDYEIKLVLEHLIKAELVMDVDKLYPVSKLFIMYQKLMHLNTEFVIQRIDMLIKKYKFFRGDRYGYYNVLKSLNKEEFIGSLIKVCPELLQTANESFLSPIPKRRHERVVGGMSSDASRAQEKPDALVHNICGSSLHSQDKTRFSMPDCNKLHFRRSSESRLGAHEEGPNEQSLSGGVLESTQLSTEEGAQREQQQRPSFEEFVFEERSKRDPRCRQRIEQCRKEFEEDFSIRRIPHLISDDLQKSKEDFVYLDNIIDSGISALLFSSNSIVSKSLIQLNVAREREDLGLFELIVKILIKLTGCREFMEELSYKSLHLINVELIKMVRCNSLIGDVLINTCLNTDPLTILSIYLDLVENRSLKEICMKLIWRHSKIRNYIKDPQPILDLICRFYDRNLYRISEDVVLHKTCQLHLSELVGFYKEEIFQFDLRGIVKEYVKNSLSKDADIRKLRESIKRIRDSL